MLCLNCKHCETVKGLRPQYASNKVLVEISNSVWHPFPTINYNYFCYFLCVQLNATAWILMRWDHLKVFAIIPIWTIITRLQRHTKDSELLEGDQADSEIQQTRRGYHARLFTPSLSVSIQEPAVHLREGSLISGNAQKRHMVEYQIPLAAVGVI